MNREISGVRGLEPAHEKASVLAVPSGRIVWFLQETSVAEPMCVWTSDGSLFQLGKDGLGLKASRASACIQPECRRRPNVTVIRKPSDTVFP